MAAGWQDTWYTGKFYAFLGWVWFRGPHLVVLRANFWFSAQESLLAGDPEGSRRSNLGGRVQGQSPRH